MGTKGLNHKLILVTTFLMLPLGLISVESRGCDDFFDAQDEREIEEIQKKEAVVKKFSEKYNLVFFYLGNQAASNDAAKYVQQLVEKYNWLTYAISLNGIFIDGFDNNKVNNGVYDEFRDRTNSPSRNFKGPSLYLFNPINDAIISVAAGSMEFQEIEDLIYTRYRYFGL